MKQEEVQCLLKWIINDFIIVKDVIYLLIYILRKKQNSKDNISLSIQFFYDNLKPELSRKSEVILQFISEVVPQMLNNEFLVQGTVTRLTSELQNEINELKEKIPSPKEMGQIQYLKSV